MIELLSRFFYFIFFDNNTYPVKDIPNSVTNPEKIHDIAKAMSDDFRIRIISILLEFPPMRYSELLKTVEPENSTDSGKLAYHLNILSEAGLITKRDDSYRVTEMGTQIYASMNQTVKDWDELARREELKSYSGWEAAFLLWSDSLTISAVIFIVIGETLFLFNREVIYLLLLLIGLFLGYLAIRSKPMEQEEKKKTITDLKRLLGDNKLMPELITALGVNGSTYVIIIGLLYITEYIVLDFLNLVILMGSFLGVIIAIWLTQRLMETWKDFQEGKPITDYRDTLRTLTTITHSIECRY